jgi:hypothetical protein
MAGKSLHETGITVSTPMPATHIGVETVVKTGDRRSGENGLAKNLSYLHLYNYNGGSKKIKRP